MERLYTIVSDGNVFRIKEEVFGKVCFVGLLETLEFKTKEAAEEYIHRFLSLKGWKEV